MVSVQPANGSKNDERLDYGNPAPAGGGALGWGWLLGLAAEPRRRRGHGRGIVCAAAA